MIYIVPSRGRPHSVDQVVESFLMTRTFAEVFFALDASDPTLPQYLTAIKKHPSWVQHGVEDTRSMVSALNHWAVIIADKKDHPTIGFMGDDHRPRTVSWDVNVAGAMFGGASSRLVYCNDMLQGANLPTQVAMPARWIRALRKMAPAELFHLYVDNYWKTLGERLGRIEYLPSTIIEHMHPVAGKAEWDDNYRRVNAGNVYAQDDNAFITYMGTKMDDDVRCIKEVV